MIKLDQFLDKKIGEKIKNANLEKELAHKSSGKLSASKLGDPLQWQILYVLGVPQKEIEEYTLRKFLRGTQVEDWLLSNVDCVEKQKFVEYRNVVGYADAVVDTKEWNFKVGEIPLEIKSTSNAKFKRIVQQGADRAHKLQAGLYAIALNTDHFGVCYVATDDLRVHTLLYPTSEFREEVDRVITNFDLAREEARKGVYPEFEATEKWQKNLEYCKYPEFMDLKGEELAKKIKENLK